MTTRDAQATWLPSPYFTAGRNGFKPHYLILHGTAGGNSALGIASWFRSTDPPANAAAHYVIGPDGLIVQCVDEDDWAWANGQLSAGHDAYWQENINPNWITISIEHVKSSVDNSDQLTDAQKQASFGLVKRICDRWQIPARLADGSGGITSHASIDPVNRRSCPGPYPWDELFASLKGGEIDPMLQPTDPYAQQFFSNFSDQRWHCKQTNFDVAFSILAFYRSLNGALRLPISPEFVIVQGVTAQAFEGGIVAYDPSRKLDNPPYAGDCYLVHINTGPGQQIIARALVDPLNKQIAALQEQLKQLPAAQMSQQLADFHNRLTQIQTLAKV